MASVTVRHLEPEVIDQLKLIAAGNGRSMQQELRLLMNRFVDLPTESRFALTPMAALPLPVWYEKLWEIRFAMGTIPLGALPARMSQFRRLEGPTEGPTAAEVSGGRASP